MMQLINHVQTDPNAKYHSLLGGIAFIVTAIAAGILISPYYSIAFGFIASLCTGIAIEVAQRAFLNGKNSTKESMLDALGTFLWFLYPVVAVVKNDR